MSRSRVFLAVIVALVASTCGGEDSAETEATTTTVRTATTAMPLETTAIATGCADVIDVTIEPGNGSFTVSATVSSADTGWDKYADAWQVRTTDGELLGERILTHPHETEQPFTRSLSGVEIPPTVSQVVVAARDSVVGFCGAEFVAEVVHP